MSGIAMDGKQAVTMLERDGEQLVVVAQVDGRNRIVEPERRRRISQFDGSRPPCDTDDRRRFDLCLHREKESWRPSIRAPANRNGSTTWWLTSEASRPITGWRVRRSSSTGWRLSRPVSKGASIVAYHAESGRLAWKSGNDTAGYSSPALLTVGGRRQIVAFTGQSAVGLEPKTGAQLWRHEYTTDFDCNIATPVAVGDDVFISSGENHGCALLALKPKDDVFEVTEVWKSFGPGSVMRNEWQTSILLGDFLYGFDNVGGAGPVTHLNCVNAKTGKRAWQKQHFGKGNMIAADGKLYIATIDGALRDRPREPRTVRRALPCKIV